MASTPKKRAKLAKMSPEERAAYDEKQKQSWRRTKEYKLNRREELGWTPERIIELRREYLKNYIELRNNHAVQKKMGLAGLDAKLLFDKEFTEAVKEATRFIAAMRLDDELEKLMSFDIRNLVDEDGNIKHVSQLDDAAAASIEGLDIVDTFQEGVQTGTIKKFKFAKRLDVLNLFAKRYGLIAEPAVNVTVNNDNRLTVAQMILKMGWTAEEFAYYREHPDEMRAKLALVQGGGEAIIDGDTRRAHDRVESDDGNTRSLPGRTA